MSSQPEVQFRSIIERPSWLLSCVQRQRSWWCEQVGWLTRVASRALSFSVWIHSNVWATRCSSRSRFVPLSLSKHLPFVALQFRETKGHVTETWLSTSAGICAPRFATTRSLTPRWVSALYPSLKRPDQNFSWDQVKSYSANTKREPAETLRWKLPGCDQVTWKRWSR